LKGGGKNFIGSCEEKRKKTTQHSVEEENRGGSGIIRHEETLVPHRRAAEEERKSWRPMGRFGRGQRPLEVLEKKTAVRRTEGTGGEVHASPLLGEKKASSTWGKGKPTWVGEGEKTLAKKKKVLLNSKKKKKTFYLLGLMKKVLSSKGKGEGGEQNTPPPKRFGIWGISLNKKKGKEGREIIPMNHRNYEDLHQL